MRSPRSDPLFRRIVALAAAMLCSATAAGAEEPNSARREALRNLLVHDCGSCHGLTLKGGLGRPLTPSAVADRSVAALADIILDGIPGTPMPPWRGFLTVEEARTIAEFIKRGPTP